MSLKLKIYVGLGAFILLLLVLLVIVFNTVTGLNDKQSAFAKSRYENTSLITIVRNEAAEMERLLRDALLQRPDAAQQFEELAIHRKKAADALESMKQLDQNESARQLLADVQVQLDDYTEKLMEIMIALQDGNSEQAMTELNMEHRSKELLFSRIDAYKRQLEVELGQMMQQTKTDYRELRVLLLGSFVLAMLISSALVVVQVRKVFNHIGRAITVMNKMALGSAESIERIEVDTEDEVAAVAQAYNRLADTLERHIRYERAYQKEIEEQNWLKTTIADITTMYQGVQDVGTLARRLLSKLAPLIRASYGAFYMTDESDGRHMLSKLAVYAGSESAYAKESFRFGEGLVGQCAAERQTIFLDNLSGQSVKVRSAMLEAIPSQIIIVPVEYEDRVLAVVEFGTLSAFLPLHQLLLQQVLNNAGITIRSVLDHMRVQQLLSDSQALAEELQTQSEEMHQQQEELMSINEKLEEQYRSSELRSLELQSIKAELEEKARLLEQSSRYKSEFLANMSHELRTPLNSLLILAKILQDNEEGRLCDKQVEYASAIHASGRQLLQLINDILDLSKAESGKVLVHKEPMRITEILNFAEKMFMPVAREKDIEFLIELDQGVPDIIHSDPQRLQQIMNNLLANAFKFTDRGIVTLKVSGYGETLINGAYDWLAISISDTGIGIPEDKQSLIFEAFQQADGTTNRKYGGTGLGLSISRNIAELLGGSIQVQSREGYGSIFTLYLPLDDASAFRPPLAVSVPEAAAAVEIPDQVELFDDDKASLQGYTVLVVDDDIRNVFAITALLEVQKLNVLFAQNGKESLEMLQAHPDIDLVLMDIMMPEMDGIEAIRAIRGQPGYAGLPIIALTAKAMKSDRELCIEAGASEYISKPVRQEQLLSLIRVWLFR